ncbi:MAG: class I SAM-dependent methyltransferase [Gammaproteobacteria bacterium]
MRTPVCACCGGASIKTFYELTAVPSNSCLLLPSQEEASACRRGDIVLGYCSDCGFFFNTAFDPRLTQYNGLYEETQSFSPTFRAYHKQLARKLIRRHGLKGKNIIEIGCGKGAFLNLLCGLGNNHGLGFDPSYVEDRIETQSEKNVVYIKDNFSSRHVKFNVDFICCLMTLEHIHNPSVLIRQIHDLAKSNPKCRIFFQVPESFRIVRDCAFEDIYYEHCSYFTKESLSHLFQKHGFEILNTDVVYNRQYLTLEAKLADKPIKHVQIPENNCRSIRELFDTFSQRVQKKTAKWQRKLNGVKELSKKTVLWGSGSKAVSFLTTLKVDKKIEYVVDINPYRHHHFMAATGQPIVAPEFLTRYRPDVVIIMNPNYRNEVTEALKLMSLQPEIFTL